ncbi:unnamed protein product [Paramecium primaurelia]|uniref:Uncharacterized protein n=1 Tax=Paramecium primaurelia TaxID=5886 RepID=A0A8S1M2F0_PARPR|nr:unnamed protein product [Paramecium primaurelia]
MVTISQLEIQFRINLYYLLKSYQDEKRKRNYRIKYLNYKQIIYKYYQKEKDTQNIQDLQYLNIIENNKSQIIKFHRKLKFQKKPLIYNIVYIKCKICSEWYDLNCLGILGSIEEIQKLLFYCFKCEQKLSNEFSKYIRRYTQYFIDSTFRDLKLKIGMSPHELRMQEKKNYIYNCLNE